MRSLRARVTFAAIAAAALVFLLSATAVITFFARGERADLDAALVDDRFEAEMYLMEQHVDDLGRLTIDEETAYLRDESDEVWQFYARGGLIHRTGRMLLPEIKPGYAYVEVEGERWRVYTDNASYTSPSFGNPLVQVALSADEVDARIARTRTAVVVVGAIATLLIGIPAWLLTGVALGPLARMRESATGISESGDLARRVPGDGPLEVKALAVELNGMLAKLERQVGQTQAALEATRTFTADAGHELRTPLTSLRANLDVLGREGLDPADRERAVQDALRAHARLTAMIDALQVLARGDSSVGHRRERLNLAELVDAVVVDARRRHPDTEFGLAGPADTPVDADPEGLRMLADNLVENAARHGGARVHVQLKRGPGFVRLTVEDDGPGIPDEEKRRVFDRFARGSSARNGTGSGLGLAIAAQQAQLHEGRLDLVDSPLGGARFEVTLPSS